MSPEQARIEDETTLDMVRAALLSGTPFVLVQGTFGRVALLGGDAVEDYCESVREAVAVVAAR